MYVTELENTRKKKPKKNYEWKDNQGGKKNDESETNQSKNGESKSNQNKNDASASDQNKNEENKRDKNKE